MKAVFLPSLLSRAPNNLSKLGKRADPFVGIVLKSEWHKQIVNLQTKEKNVVHKGTGNLKGLDQGCQKEAKAK